MSIKTSFRLTGLSFLVAAMALITSGCASMRAISSTPPVKAVVLEQPVEFKSGLWTTVSMPAGEYKPVLEDDYGYYYQAPSKLAARDLLSYALDGGVVIKRGETKPSKWYIVDNNGNAGNMIRTGKIPDNLQAHVIEN